MARPTKNNIEYFPHDKDMRDDPKIKALRNKYGLEGYALYNMILEYLSDSDCLLFDYQTTDWEIMAGDFGIESQKLVEIIDYMTGKLNLFCRENGYLFCRNLDFRCRNIFDRRKTDLGGLREQKYGYRKNNKVSVNNNPINAKKTTQSKVKYSKVKKSKKRVTSEIDFSQFSKNTNFIYDFFLFTLNEKEKKIYEPKTEQQKFQWLDAIEKCNRLDKHPFWKILDVIYQYRIEDGFWCKNFFTPLKLREKSKNGAKRIDEWVLEMENLDILHPPKDEEEYICQEVNKIQNSHETTTTES